MADAPSLGWGGGGGVLRALGADGDVRLSGMGVLNHGHGGMWSC